MSIRVKLYAIQFTSNVFESQYIKLNTTQMGPIYSIIKLPYGHLS